VQAIGETRKVETARRDHAAPADTAAALDARRGARLEPTAWQLLVLSDVAVLTMVAFVVPGVTAAVYGALVLGVLAARGCYRPRFTGQLGAVVNRLFTTVALVAVAVGSVVGQPTSILVLRVSPFVAVGLIGGRAVAGAGLRRLRTSTTGQPTLIVGAGALGARMAENLLQHPEYGLNPVGVVDDVPGEVLSLPLLGGSDDLTSVVRNFGIRHIVVAFGRAQEQHMVDVLRTCHSLDAEVWVVPRLFELGASSTNTDEIWGVPVVQLSRRALRSWQWRLKRLFDIPVSGLVLVALAPVLAVLALAVRVSSPGPVLFRQKRMGQRERPFDMLKFRTLRAVDDPDGTVSPIFGSSKEIQAARSRDVSARQTRLGNFLRRTSIDELPQLWNVLRGDLSLVGPRPEEIEFAIQFGDTVPGYRARHRVPAGLTGLAQVNGLRGDTSIEDRARHDNAYIDNWSFWGDVVILARTVRAVVFARDEMKLDPVVESTIDLTAFDHPTLADLDP
jgi:exopolysaccharide biosynthesis polyprenyl glycosylphosphotransferase